MRPRKRSGRPAWRNSSAAIPSSTADISRELRAETESARRIIRKRTKIANTARPRMRPPLPRWKENASSSRSVSSVPETIASPAPAASRMSTSTFRSERRRAIAKAMIPAATISPAARRAVSSGGK